MLIEATRIRGGALAWEHQVPRLDIRGQDEAIPQGQINQFLLANGFSKIDLGNVNEMLTRQSTEALYLINNQRGTLDGIVAAERLRYNTESALVVRIFAFKDGVLSRGKAQEILAELKSRAAEGAEENKLPCSHLAMTAKLTNMGDMDLIESIPWSKNAVKIRSEKTGTVTVFEPVR